MKILIELDVPPTVTSDSVTDTVEAILRQHPIIREAHVTVVSVTQIDMELRKVKQDLDHLDAIVSEL